MSRTMRAISALAAILLPVVILTTYPEGWAPVAASAAVAAVFVGLAAFGGEF